MTLVGAAVALAVACAPAPRHDAEASGALYVLNAGDRTVTVLTPSGEPAATVPLPPGPAPHRVAPGPSGGLLVLAMESMQPGSLTFLSRDPTRGARPGAAGSWSVRRVPLPSSPDALLAGDGGHLAAVVYHRSPSPPASSIPAGGPGLPAPRCLLALVGVPAGVAAAPRPVCGPGELVSGLAIDTGSPAGPVVYVTVRSDDPAGGGTGPLGTGRVVALRPEGDAPAALLRLTGAPTRLVLGPAPGGAGRRLYVVEALAGPEQEPPAPFRGRLLGLEPTTLQPEAVYHLDSPLGRLAVAPDGEDVYGLLDGTVQRFDLASGREERLATLPGTGLDLAVTADRVYVVSGASQDVVWAVPRRVGPMARVESIRVGRGAVGIVAIP